MCQIGRMFGLKKGYFDFYSRSELSAYISLFYYENFDSIKAIFRSNENMILMDRCILIKNVEAWKLRQFRIRSLENYSIIIVDENLNLKQFIAILNFRLKPII
jgi:hypothetical protein